MLITKNKLDLDFENFDVSSFWSSNAKSELKMHKIHAYPAKFSSLVVERSLQYAAEKNINVNSIGDIFCGCGTTALEAKKGNLPFWGYDINPVATLIAKVKSHQYNEKKVLAYFEQVVSNYKNNSSVNKKDILWSNQRIDYWFHEGQKADLLKLLTAIRIVVPNGIYKDFFLCAFSNILKGTSRWLTKSIKPQIDPNKEPNLVLPSFVKQVDFMIKANAETLNAFKTKSSTKIATKNFLATKIKSPFVDLLLTSPPYVTSYEYADLHQLSSLWLGYTEDYRTLREGTIGSLYYNSISSIEINKLNPIGKNIYDNLFLKDKSQAKSVAKYLIDMNKIAAKSYEMLNVKGLAIFVIGNTTYQNVLVDNAKYLCACMLENGFTEVNVFKRKVGPKILTPYRDEKGKFSNNSKDREVYSHEFVVVGNKKK